MSKAEDLAKKLFPLLETDTIGNNPYISYNTEQLAKQEGFVEGYHQAEKLLELTWEDIQNIKFIIAEMMKECFTENISWNTHEEFSKEVLKRFNNQRKK